ncbi:SDR family NAD(P)-dependent oxidoreductase [Novosphingobium bradum]|uniref:SDR family NAD(P)-dependent oxidoreductase n=1 Tax=Novosphingobium bradum TaxID=1737444 RepID=A0ABV7IT34_9SPHN
MAGRLENKVIVVAGAGNIASGLVPRFVAEGARVVLGDIDHEAATSLAQAVDPSGATVVPTHLDGADEASVAAIVELAMSRFGALHGCHANFAITPDSRTKAGVVDLPMEIWDDMMRVNARGYVLCTRLAVPAMIASGGGAMLYTTSADAFRGAPVRVAYQMSKAAILALMRHTASRYGRKGIRANAISPGLTLNPDVPSGMSADLLQRLMDDTARLTAFPDRVGRPADIASAAAFLLSDEGSYITGQTLAVDGGLTMRN